MVLVENGRNVIKKLKDYYTGLVLRPGDMTRQVIICITNK